MAAATRPGNSVGMSAAPRATPPSISMKLATSGPPNSAKIAEDEPAALSRAVSRGSRRAIPTIPAIVVPNGAADGDERSS